MDQTQFDQLLQTHFPDIHRLHKLGQSDVHLWELLYALLQMNTDLATGRIEVLYTKGHIDTIKKTTDLLAHKASRPGY
jgi:hypothetical protein